MSARRRLASVAAHPDDDTYSNAGLLALLASDVDYTLIVATSGEAGPIGDPSLATRDTLAQVREREQRDALAAVGLAGVQPVFLRYPDGGLADVAPEQLAARIEDVLVRTRPQVVVGFGPDGVSGHPDHVATGAATDRAFAGARERLGQPDDALLRLLHACVPASGIERFFRMLREQGIDLDPDAPLMPRGVPDEAITVVVDTSSVVRRKLDALRAHRTQQEEFELIPGDVRDMMLSTEWFVQAWPPPEPGAPVLTDVFAELRLET